MNFVQYILYMYRTITYSIDFFFLILLRFMKSNQRGCKGEDDDMEFDVMPFEQHK